VVVVRRFPEGWRCLILRCWRNWDFPKGTVEAGEAPLDAARREVAEESALTDLEFRWGEIYCETAPYSGGKGRALLSRAVTGRQGGSAGQSRTRTPGAPRVSVGELRRCPEAVAATVAAGVPLGAQK